MLWDTLSDAGWLLVLVQSLCKFSTHQTTKGISAAIASSILAAARGGLPCISVQILSRDTLSWGISIRDENARSGSSSLLHSICDIGKDWKIKMCLPSLLRICSSNDICS